MLRIKTYFLALPKTQSGSLIGKTISFPSKSHAIKGCDHETCAIAFCEKNNFLLRTFRFKKVLDSKESVPPNAFLLHFCGCYADIENIT